MSGLADTPEELWNNGVEFEWAGYSGANKVALLVFEAFEKRVPVASTNMLDRAGSKRLDLIVSKGGWKEVRPVRVSTTCLRRDHSFDTS